MYLAGMGGTGKTQVLKVLTHFFAQRKEAHRFIVVAPTGTAAALLGGSTYHSMFGINDRSGQEMGQTLTRFFSDDPPRMTQSDPDEARDVKHVAEITKEMMEGFWMQPPSSTDKHVAGKLSLCIGLPVMIRCNYAMEMCMMRGQEGFCKGTVGSGAGDLSERVGSSEITLTQEF
jgi:hypothetical protein